MVEKYKLIILFLIQIITTTSKLRFVYELFRHGARTPWPELTNNTDIFGEHWVGRAELTELGIRQHYLLGRRNRERYKDFLDNTYSPSEVYVLSTDTNRTIMSAYSQLQGLFSLNFGPKLRLNFTQLALPPVSDYNFTDDISSLNDFALPYQAQVIPIHVMSKDITTYNIGRNNCKGIGASFRNNIEKGIVKESFLNFTTKYSKDLADVNITIDDFVTLHQFCDIYYTDYYHGRDLNLIRKADINLVDLNTTCSDILDIALFEADLGDSHNGVVEMSNTFSNIVAYMTNRITNDRLGIGYSSESPKMVMISGHDTNLASVEAYLKSVFPSLFTTYTYPYFASSMYFELYQNDETYNIVALFNSNILFNITFDEFKDEIVKDSMVQKDIDDFCGFKRHDHLTALDVILITTTVVVVLFVVGYFVYRLLKRRKLMNGFNTMKIDFDGL
jgi:hypothetical protein